LHNRKFYKRGSIGAAVFFMAGKVRLFGHLVATILIASIQAHAEPSSVLAEFPFQLRDGMIWIAIHVPKAAQPLNFMLDSGAQVSVMNTGVARRLDLKLGRPVSVRGVKSSVVGYWPEHLLARLGDVSLPKDFLAVDLGQLSRACGCGVDGLLGADFFKGRIVQIDFQNSKIRLLKSVAPDGNEDSLPLFVQTSGFLVNIQVNDGNPQKVRVDTGCASALQWVMTIPSSEPYSRQIAVGMTEVSMPLVKRTVRIGGTEFQSVPTGLQDHQIFPGEAGLLGTPLLSRFALVTFDTLSKRLILKK
jgi:hypothetical protein